jgi:hypothetical protein
MGIIFFAVNQARSGPAVRARSPWANVRHGEKSRRMVLGIAAHERLFHSHPIARTNTCRIALLAPRFPLLNKSA